MCKFCDKIYPIEDTNDILFCEGKYSKGGPDKFIVKDEDHTFNIVTDTGDPWEYGVVGDIHYCPYCGAGLH